MRFRIRPNARKSPIRSSGNANPRAYSAEIGPGRPIKHLNPATQKAILTVADNDFIEGIRFSLATVIVFLAVVLAAGIAWFPRGSGSIADAHVRREPSRRRRPHTKARFHNRNAVDESIEVPFFRRLDERFFALQTRMESHKVDGHTQVKRRLGAL